MTLSDEYERRNLDSIVIDRESRQRRDIALDPGLLASIRRNGVIQPIIIRRTDGVLVAGERRLAASRELGLPDIPIRYLDSLSPIEAEIIELEENAKRLDLVWQDRVRATARIHELYKGLDSDWTMDQTAEALGLTAGNSIVSRYVKIAGMMEDERILGARTFNEAEGIIKRRDQRLQGAALEDLLRGGETPAEPAAEDEVEDVSEIESGETWQLGKTLVKPRSKFLPPVDPILNQSFLDWAPSYEGPKFDLIHCDFPYGIENFAGPQSRGSSNANPGGIETQLYDDTLETYQRLLECFCRELNRFCSLSAHLVFWYSGRAKHLALTMKTFRLLAPSWTFSTFPLIWHKSDNAGIVPNSKNDPRHIYETALFGTRGGRNLIRTTTDLYSCPKDIRLHPSTKPEPMLRHFFQMLVDENSRVLDPTAGSGAALRAAESLGAKAVLGLELDPQVCEQSNQFYRNWRLLRGTLG